jgi:hypothetical protein
MSDERTIREDLVIREGSSPEAKKGSFIRLKSFRKLVFCEYI